MIAPTINFDFLSASLDARIAVSRSGSTATAVNSLGKIQLVNADLPRFDYDPVTLACKGLLVEQSRQNIFTNSGNVSGYTLTGLTVSANQITAPDGTTSVFELLENTSSTSHSVGKSSTPTGTYTVSLFAKYSGRYLVIALSCGALGSAQFASAVFDIQNGIVTATNQTGAQTYLDSSITDFGGGWYRCSLTATTTATAQMNTSFSDVSTAPTANYGRNAYTGDVTKGGYLWGAQAEAGTFPTSYIPTAGAAVTRNADVVTVTGSNFSDFWQAAKGGTSVSYIPSTISGTRPVVQFDDGTANEIIALRGNAANPELYIVDGGTPQAQIDAGTLVAGTTHTLTGWWEPNFCAARLDNGARVVDNSATIPTVTQMRLGSDGTNYLNGHLAVVNYYDKFSGQIYARRKNKAVFSVL
jgi:hypothetical protein